MYLETSFFSECTTIRTGTVDLGRRATSLNWGQTYAKSFELFISPEVVRELSSPGFPEVVRVPALEMLTGLDVLRYTSEVGDIAEVLVRQRVMPAPAVEGDAIHLAFCVAHQVDYLLTWNQKHLANPNKRSHLAVLCAQMNLRAPQIVTPDLMIVEDDDE